MITLISIIQEIRSKRIIDKLSIISSTKANVIRDGKNKIINIESANSTNFSESIKNLILFEKNINILTSSLTIEDIENMCRKSKREKNGEIVFYDNALLNNNKRNLELIQAIKYDISTGFKGFYLKYQPIVDLNGSLVGVEALIRWKSDTYGEVSPNEFIPILENDAAFYDLGVWILSKALRDMRNVIKNFPNLIYNFIVR